MYSKKNANIIMRMMASICESPFIAAPNKVSFKETKKANVIAAKIGSSFFTVCSLTEIGEMIEAIPTTSRIFTTLDPITFASVIS